MRIAIGSDHGGFELKSKLINHFKEIDFEDVGCYDKSSVDYPDFAFKVGEKIQNNEVDFGIVICSTGIGISIAANKVRGVRCALVTSLMQARLTRCHNNSNCLALGAFVTTFEEAKEIVATFISTDFEGDRHLRRINKIKDYEER
jgi:ribose 5-phosphate isomerase B